MRFADGEVTVVSDLPKRDRLGSGPACGAGRAHPGRGIDDPHAYVDVTLKVPERKYTAWPPAIRSAFETARTVRTGKPTFRLVRDGEAPA